MRLVLASLSPRGQSLLAWASAALLAGLLVLPPVSLAWSAVSSWSGLAAQRADVEALTGRLQDQAAALEARIAEAGYRADDWAAVSEPVAAQRAFEARLDALRTALEEAGFELDAEPVATASVAPGLVALRASWSVFGDLPAILRVLSASAFSDLELSGFDIIVMAGGEGRVRVDLGFALVIAGEVPDA